MSPVQPPPLDELVFLDEPATSADAGKSPSEPQLTWRVMIVDDDPDVHSATTLALNNLEIQHRMLTFLHAYSALEAKQILQQESDIAVILLDVVMEQADAGLQLVNTIRNELGLTETRIILRTGQPGYAPEIEAIRDFDINDYKTKSELTRTKLFTAVTAAVRSYEQIRSINVLNARLRDYAFIDQLTHLPNRQRLLQALEQALTQTSRPNMTLALVDIDHFAATNNALGHQFGDGLLCALAERLRTSFEASCTIARLNSDTFAILGDDELVQPNLILSLFYSPFHIDQQEVQLSATIGLVKLNDYQGEAANALKDTHIALKRAKTTQRSRFQYFTHEMGSEIREHVHLMRALDSAFHKEHMFVVYQPQVRIGDGKVVGAEALLRWKTDEGNYIAPENFIPVAEYSGLIIELGNWVLREACYELKALVNKGYTDFKMSVNVSQAQFSHPEFLNSVCSAISETGIPPNLLDLEITESMAMDDPNSFMETLRQLKSIGVQISIDDFGTGFSSLKYLQQLPIDQLKIDRSFVCKIGETLSDNSIPRMIIQLCNSLGLSVIAEGVETVNQAKTLESLGCTLAQGFYYSKPLESLQLSEWLSLTHQTQQAKPVLSAAH